MTTLKDRLREEAANRRSEMSPAQRDRAAADLAEWMYSCPFRLEYDVTVAAYVPVGTEPGSTAMLDALVDRGVTVLVPVVPDGEPAPLDWARYTGPLSLDRGRWGLREPATDRVGVTAIRAASMILVPALAVDKTGVRLGRGAGYYDRTLHGLSAELVAVVYDEEIVDALPSGDHDVPVGWALTPGGGFQELR
ncbi:5-formyltetrahydrofolate cyclo-ligase [Gordonia sp. zg691]|uniref:5-formyltetrahydrofolate cyclo-ligase n=1 Tax=Gordonia jinghuaiqii TaxID=2758710 RepID=A0A7D7LTJ8_9ACTN|nr:5-formyltetrahydrofolate cyclo-ligase [Gordonia jinghuaiqii]MBD0862240.1 5-formyltetrahydrofolate cyclo-ligase [Gordonia jinghuaiqii]MCR5978535.1 5-formyltetrahydrofolate cyclo-ligase [Gordonia jinghuaiqii]QMT02860.1 5-formyltetrahydrofolate cyclo-ligase [Gordonia jinghuaiqii]